MDMARRHRVRPGWGRGAARRLAAALTLIETLAALVILSAAAAATIGVAGPMSATQRRLGAAETVRVALDRCRLVAQSAGGAELAFGTELLGRAARGPSDQAPGLRETRSALPMGWSAALVRPAREGQAPGAGALRFGASGLCADATIFLTGPQGASIRLELLGISGQVFEVDPGAEGAP